MFNLVLDETLRFVLTQIHKNDVCLHNKLLPGSTLLFLGI